MQFNTEKYIRTTDKCIYMPPWLIFLSFLLAKIEYQDIIGIDIPKDEENKETINRNVYYIRPTQKENKLEKKQLHITGSKSEMLQLCSDVNEKIHKGMAKLSEKMYV